MSALRRAGVWLGLIEDDDEELYDEPEPVARGRRERGRAGRRVHDDDDDEFGDGHASRSQPRRLDDTGVPAVPRTRAGDRRREDDDTTRAPVRDSTVSYLTREGRPRQADRHPTRDNLALAAPAEQTTPDEGTERRYQITTLHPTTFREARTIGEHFRQGNPVIMNLTEMDEADARRLVDFGAGLVFGLRGTMDRVTNRVFLLSPANVQVTPEDKARIAEGGFFRQR